ncbi:MAG: VanZ family protein [Fimbriimonadales bacterium]
MRNWLSWVVGFALTFSVVSLLLLVYSFAQPSLWLPILFGVAFYGLLSFSPRMTLEIRVGLATLFGSVSCILWMISGSETFQYKHAELQLAFENLLGVMGLIGVVIAIGGILKAPAKSRPSINPIVLLMVTGWLISYFSSGHGGSSPMIDWVMRAFHFDQETAENAVLVFRKTVHFTFYSVVAASAFATAVQNGAARRICFVAALLTTFAYAGFDEMRQSTQPDRNGSIWDVMLDMSGGCAALIVVNLVTARRAAGGPKNARRSSTL